MPAGILSLALLFSACGSTSDGALTGTVRRCTEYLGSIEVHVYQGTKLIASQSVQAGHNYRFTLRPGIYRLSTGTAAQGVFPSVKVHSGSTAIQNLPPQLCM